MAITKLQRNKYTIRAPAAVVSQLNDVLEDGTTSVVVVTYADGSRVKLTLPVDGEMIIETNRSVIVDEATSEIRLVAND